jgi:hypothetical protein
MLIGAGAQVLHAADDLGLQIHGFVSQGYLVTEGNNYLGETEDGGTLNFNEFAVNVTATPINNLRIGVQIFARSVGDYGADTPEIDWAYADYHLTDDLGVTVGRFKIPHGLYNESRDLDMTRTEVFLPMSVYSTRLRDVYLAVNGAEIYGTIPSKTLGSLDAVAYIGGQNFATDGAVAAAFEDDGYSTVSSVSVERVEGASLTWNTPLEGFRLRASALDAHNIQVAGTADGTVLDAGGGPGGANVLGNSTLNGEIRDFCSGILSMEYQYRDLILAAEYTREYGKISTNSVTSAYVNAPNPPPAPPGSTSTLNLGSTAANTVSYIRLEGAYVSASYRVAPKCDVSIGRGIAFSDYDHRGLSYNRQWAFAARYDILDNWLIKAEWDFVQGDQEVYQTENPSGIRRVWDIIAVKTTVDF